MKKSEVLGYFGGVVKTAAALGTSKTTVSMWGEEVPWRKLPKRISSWE